MARYCIITYDAGDISTGHAIRSTMLVEMLSSKGSVHVITFPEDERKLIKIIENLNNITFFRFKGNEKRSRRLVKILGFDPNHVIRFYIYMLLTLLKIRNIAKKCDAIIIESAIFIPFAFLAKIIGKPLIFSSHGSTLLEKPSNLRWLYSFLRRLFWSIMEPLIIRLSDFVIAISHKDKEYWKNKYHYPENRIITINYRLPSTMTKNLLIQRELENTSRPIHTVNHFKYKNNLIKITFIGNLYAPHNREAANLIIERIAPKFEKYKGRVKFLIVGKGKELLSNKGKSGIVEFTGYVDNISDIIYNSDILIAPLMSGTGVKTKMLLYLKSGKWIVATKTAIEGIPEGELRGKLVIVNDDVKEFVERLEKVICLYFNYC